MVSEQKFASLSSGLLARKGGAKPAMRRQGYMNPQGDIADDLGWNDMGYQPPRPVEEDGGEVHAPSPSEVHRQIDQIAEGFGNGEESEDMHLPGLDGRAGLTAMHATASEAETDDTEEAQSDAASVVEESPVDTEVETAPAEPVEEIRTVKAVGEVIPMRPAKSPTRPERVLARNKVAFTLRLDQQRHLKLRLASALENRSAQQLVTEALDEFFKQMPDLEQLATNSRDRK